MRLNAKVLAFSVDDDDEMLHFHNKMSSKFSCIKDSDRRAAGR